MTRIAALILSLISVLLGIAIGAAITAPRAEFQLKLDADKVTPEVSAGRCFFKHASDWIWNSPQFGFSGYMTPACLELGGLVEDPGEREGLRVALLKPADVRVHDFAPIGPDGQIYNPRQPCNAQTKINCLADFDGRGEMLGLMLGAWYDVGSKPIGLRPEAGLMLYHTSFDVNASPASPGCDQALTWTRWDHASSTRITPYLAGTLSYGPLSIRAEWFQKVAFQEGDNPGFVGATDNGPMRRLSVQMTYAF